MTPMKSYAKYGHINIQCSRCGFYCWAEDTALIDGQVVCNPPCGEITSTPKTPQPFIIREEADAVHADMSYFRAYREDMTPLYMGERTLAALEKRLRGYEDVSTIDVIYLEKE